MDAQTRNNFAETFKNILKTKTSQEFESGVLFDYKSTQGSPGNKVLEQSMKYFLDINIDRPTVFAHKGRLRDLHILESIDVSTDANVSQNVPKQSKKSSTGSCNGSVGGMQDRLQSMDLDGSPLKLQAYADLSAFDSPSSLASPKYVKQVKNQEKQNNGIATRKAKRLLSMFSTFFTNNIIGHENIELIPDFWVLSDASDIKSTIIQGVQPVSLKGEVGLRITTVTLSEKNIDLKNEIFQNSANMSDPQCYSRYNVIDSIKDDRAGYQGSLAVDLEWKRATHLLQKPPSHATAFVKASVSTGDMRSPAYSFYQELTLLKSFVSAVTTGDVNWIAEKSDVPLIDSVKELIEQLRQGDRVVSSEEEDETVNLISQIENLVFKERQDLDFTDHLWKVLISCSAYSDLIASLQYVFNCLETGRIQPMVHTSNHTTMAQLARDSFSGRMMTPPLKGVTPIKLLVEMGAEKLKRDYINAFLSTNLTTLSHLNHLVSAAGSLENHLVQLEKQQNVLEMVTMLKLFLSLPHATLSSSARQMIKHYETNAVDEKYVFEFPVPMSSITSVVKTYAPCMWKASFDQTVGSVTESTVYCLTTSQPFLHVQKQFDTAPGPTDAMPTETNGMPSDTMPEADKYFLIKKQEFVTLF